MAPPVGVAPVVEKLLTAEIALTAEEESQQSQIVPHARRSGRARTRIIYDDEEDDDNGTAVEGQNKDAITAALPSAEEEGMGTSQGSSTGTAEMPVDVVVPQEDTGVVPTLTVGEEGAVAKVNETVLAALDAVAEAEVGLLKLVTTDELAAAQTGAAPVDSEHVPPVASAPPAMEDAPSLSKRKRIMSAVGAETTKLPVSKRTKSVPEAAPVTVLDKRHRRTVGDEYLVMYGSHGDGTWFRASELTSIDVEAAIAAYHAQQIQPVVKTAEAAPSFLAPASRKRKQLEDRCSEETPAHKSTLHRKATAPAVVEATAQAKKRGANQAATLTGTRDGDVAAATVVVPAAKKRKARGGSLELTVDVEELPTLVPTHVSPPAKKPRRLSTSMNTKAAAESPETSSPASATPVRHKRKR